MNWKGFWFVDILFFETDFQAPDPVFIHCKCSVMNTGVKMRED